MEYQDFIISSLTRASEIAVRNFGKVTSSTKTGDNNQVLTQTDLEIGKLLVDAVKQSYPTYNVIDEEAGVIDNHSEFTWIIDPIDGTSNFANGVPTYGVMMGLLYQSQPIAGGIALPSFSDIYYSEKGRGAFCNGERIFVTKEDKLLSTLVAYGIDGHQENPQLTYDEVETLAKVVLSIRNLRSSNSAFDIVMVAKGSYGDMLNKTSKIWDNVAPHILIEEAGGVYTDFYGNSMDYTNALAKSQTNFTVCMSTPALHPQLQATISK